MYVLYVCVVCMEMWFVMCFVCVCVCVCVCFSLQGGMCNGVNSLFGINLLFVRKHKKHKNLSVLYFLCMGCMYMC